MLASVYSYRVMVKGVSSCCVRGRRVLSNPVTYEYICIILQLHHKHSRISLLLHKTKGKARGRVIRIMYVRYSLGYILSDFMYSLGKQLLLGKENQDHASIQLRNTIKTD